MICGENGGIGKGDQEEIVKTEKIPTEGCKVRDRKRRSGAEIERR